MSLAQLDGLLWLLGCLLPFILIQRWLHFELQAVFLILTRRPAVALGLFSFLFFPGVLLHETSHYLAALLLRVRTGRFSLLPQMLPDGNLRLGFVETAKVDVLRDSLIGLAPLVSGALVTALLGSYGLGFVPLAALIAQGQWPAFGHGLAQLPQQPDFWLWFYLAFAVSTTMLPSSSDRRAWLPIGIGLALLVGLAALAGAGPWMMTHLAPALNDGMRALALVFGISLVLHIALLLPVGLVRLLLSKMTGLTVR